jgi:hypothetical protein
MRERLLTAGRVVLVLAAWGGLMVGMFALTASPMP